MVGESKSVLSTFQWTPLLGFDLTSITSLLGTLLTSVRLCWESSSCKSVHSHPLYAQEVLSLYSLFEVQGAK